LRVAERVPQTNEGIVLFNAERNEFVQLPRLHP